MRHLYSSQASFRMAYYNLDYAALGDSQQIRPEGNGNRYEGWSAPLPSPKEASADTSERRGNYNPQRSVQYDAQEIAKIVRYNDHSHEELSSIPSLEHLTPRDTYNPQTKPRRKVATSNAGRGYSLQLWDKTADALTGLERFCSKGWYCDKCTVRCGRRE